MEKLRSKIDDLPSELKSSSTVKGIQHQLKMLDMLAARGLSPAEKVAELVLEQDKKLTTFLSEQIPPAVEALPADHAPDDDVDDLLKEFSMVSLKTRYDRLRDAFVGDTERFKRLREYQIELIQDYIEDLCRTPTSEKCHCLSHLIYLPTGGGKTRICAELFTLLLQEDLSCLFAVHRKTLVEQAFRVFSEHKLPVRRLSEDHRAGEIVVATIQSLVRQKSLIFDVMVIDEAHTAACESYRKLLSACRAENERLDRCTLFLGLTATPIRLDPSEMLSSVFKTLISGPSIRQLLDLGFLVPPIVFGGDDKGLLKALNESRDVGFGKGSDRLILSAVDSDAWIRHLVTHWRLRADGMRTICFPSSIKHSKRIVKAFQAAGVSSVHVDGRTANGNRTAAFERLKSREVLVLSSVGVLSEGFDCPSVECVILARPTSSVGLYIQQVGRGLRCSPGKRQCIVLDHSGNTMRHGTVEQTHLYLQRDWRPAVEVKRLGDDLEEREKQKRIFLAKMRKRICRCSDCGAIFDRKKASGCPGPACRFLVQEEKEEEKAEVATALEQLSVTNEEEA